MKINKLYGVILGSVCAMGFGISALADHESVVNDCYSADALQRVDVHMGGYSCVVEKVKPGTVSIVVQPKEETQAGPVAANPMMQPGEEGGGGGASGGSGFFVSADGYLVTNNHVVAHGDPKSIEYKVFMEGEKEPLDGKLIGTDEEADIAVLKVDVTGKNVNHLHWADLKNMRVGDKVIAIGSPFGLDFTVTMGNISAFRGFRLDADPASADINAKISGENSHIVQTDAAVNSGNSGGALVNIMGDVVGVNQAIISQMNAGIAFAISANYAKTVVDEIIKNGHVVRGWIGMAFSIVKPGEEKNWKLEKAKYPYVLVKKIYTGGPADGTGLRVDDVIIAVNGKPLTEPNSLKLAISNAKPGSIVTFDVIHRKGAKKETVKVEIEDRENMPEELKQEIAREKEEMRKQEEQRRRGGFQGPGGMMPPGMGPGDEEGPMMPPGGMMPGGPEGQMPLPPGSPFGFEPAPKQQPQQKEAPAPKKQNPKAKKQPQAKGKKQK